MLRTYHRSDHLRVTSRRTCAPPCTLMGATRSAYTGFSLFTSEIAKTHRNVLKSKCFSSGQTNMKTISQLWNSQSTSIRLSYKNTAATKAKIAAFDTSRRYNKFNMVMKVLGSTSVSPSRAADSNQKENSLFHLLGGGAFATKVAKQTALCMQEKHTRKALLRFMPNAKQQSTSSGSVDDRRPNRYKYYYCPPMKYFTSFTEMQRCVAPTRFEVYASVMGLAMNNLRTRQGQQFLHQRFYQLSPEELRVFNPISDEEAPRFEKMCGRHSGGWNHDEFEIMRHFCRFRGIACVAHTPPTVAPSAIELFKAIFSADRLHDSIFLKVRRCLEQASAQRSSDCSAFLYKRYVSKPGSTSGEMAVVPPSMYSIQSSMSDVKVATMLQETRMNQSVYDDILERASMFRSANQNTILDNLYNPSISSAAPMSLIKSTMSTTARQIARLRVRVAAQLAKASAHVPEKKMAKVTTTRKKRAVMPSKQQSVAVASIQRELKPSPAVVQLSARKETAQGKVTAVRRPSSTTSSAVAHREASPRKLEKTLRANRSPQRRVQQRLLRMKKVLRASPRGTVHRVRSAVKVPTTPSIRAAPSSTAKADPTKLVAQIQSQLAALMG